MQRRYKIALAVPALCLVAGIGAGSVTPDAPAPEAPAETVEPAILELGAFTFHIEQPHHTTYVVTRMSAVFTDGAAAELHATPETVVRLRNAVFDAVLDVRPSAITGDVDLDALSERLGRTLTNEVPDIVSIDVNLLGSQDVPRR
jgi:hypothetical protein